jgi:hypothetical protein
MDISALSWTAGHLKGDAADLALRLKILVWYVLWAAPSSLVGRDSRSPCLEKGCRTLSVGLEVVSLTGSCVSKPRGA